MNDTTNNHEDGRLANIMALIGLIVMVCLLAWLAVQLVRLTPTIFANLASVFNENQRELADKTDNEDENVIIIPDDEEVDDEDDTESEDDTSNEDDVATSTPNGSDVKPTPAPTPKPAPVQYKTVVTYKTPVSDPKGYTDLEATFVAVGTMSGNDRFSPQSSLERGEDGAMQFRVKNIGTKTSGEWRFTAELPSGSTITSLPQRPLLPKETATLTVAFGEIDSRNDRSVGISLIGGNDNTPANNGFRVKVSID